MKTTKLVSSLADYNGRTVHYDEHAPMRMHLGEYNVLVWSDEQVGTHLPGERFEVPARWFPSPGIASTVTPEQFVAEHSGSARDEFELAELATNVEGEVGVSARALLAARVRFDVALRRVGYERG